MLRVGLLGAGGISSSHVPAWEEREDTDLVAVCDLRPENLEKYPGKKHYTSLDEMLDDETLDILDICVPTPFHVDSAVKAMDRGIHVICEKPCALDPKDIERAYEAAKRNRVNFMVAQVVRWFPEYDFLKKLSESGKYGKVISGSMERCSAFPDWSAGGWMFDESKSGLVPFDLHIHDLDFLVYAFGAPKNIEYRRDTRPEQDVLHTCYDFEDFFVTAKAGWYAGCYPFTAGYVFQFEKAVVEYKGGACKVYENNGTSYSPTEATDPITGNVSVPQSDGYKDEINYFTDCVLAGTFPEKVKKEELITVANILRSYKK